MKGQDLEDVQKGWWGLVADLVSEEGRARPETVRDGVLHIRLKSRSVLRRDAVPLLRSPVV